MKITEIRGRKGNRYVVRDLFGFRQTGVEKGMAVGEFYATGKIPGFLARLRTSGLTVPDSLFAERILSTAEVPPAEMAAEEVVPEEFADADVVEEAGEADGGFPNSYLS